MTTVDVVLPVPVDQTYTYGVPTEMRDTVDIGHRVLVPFGKRRLTGVVASEGPDPESVDFALKDILDVLDERPACSEEMLRLTKWIANYYVCSWGEAIKAALPSGINVKSTHRLRRTEEPPGQWVEHEQAGPLLADLEGRDDTTLSAIRKRLGTTVPLGLVRRLAAEGILEVNTQLSDARVSAKTATYVRFSAAFQHPSAAADLVEQLRGSKQKALIEALAGFREEGTPEPLRTDLLERAEASHSSLNSLVDKGMVETVEKEVVRSPLDDLPDPGPAPDHTLHPSQQEAYDAVARAVEDQSYQTFLLHGITGSGKTEVYIAALKDVLAQGRTGIILVPEIALTPQTVQRFRSHFGDTIAVLHSQMSMGERFDAWRQLRDGELSIAIGPRSAVLAPMDNLGLIVVDEEHESSYKQFDPAPRYHARDVAVMRAYLNDAVCVLGSATPSLESVMNAEWGKYTRLNMPERVPDSSGTSAELPNVEIVDLTLQKRKHQLEGALSEPLRAAIRARIDRGEQTILLQNRRGFAPVIECCDCGWAPLCRDCSVTMTVHKTRSGGRMLQCHYCGRTEPTMRACPSCNSQDLHQIGTGTQRVEDELNDVFPDAEVLRMDRDSTRKKHGHHKILSQFRNGADILLGTQMIAKGLDFSRVTLVGVVDADVGLLLPDFRAEERTFQLLTQVAGRAGRADLRGEVILQTRNPEHKALQFALDHDFDGFAASELEDRKILSYPPFGHLATVEFRGPKEARVERLAENWTKALRKHSASDVLIGDPSPASVKRVKKQFRYRTVLKSRQSQKHLQSALRRTEQSFGSVPNGYHVSIDVDAVGLL
ncbi:primosomal protein N' [Longibacter salinarum]|uniref:Replication restart protein PriA n=1 Tax=Longibacter salinarum TaxID=1850348 RepID=A0A2A8CVH6_9BACT|nr:primosomal protein N' [Longibacter salinarum]PEN12594.1 primosomal protein N' [Longibacter salinarum]